MAVISLEDMQFKAPIGFYPEEQVLSNSFSLTVMVAYNTNDAGESDDLTKTLNYETLYRLCVLEMRQPARLIENVAQRIILRIADYFPAVEGIRVQLRKHHPPLGGQVAAAVIQLGVGTLKI